ncbi:uncharacterized protein E0L32_001150 [Thyridium curvatum]|uniref:Chromosome segregation in meiosis protein n=1 Tax=Thyridium curvatum TaxID=1093900 RepID=A0A507AN60_9PEZI|nr:uncharacterized protein E0L32_001150 [Thyridium curvatum]TPX11332.1 hypothetical protein E0L32_001150 [Thyridium curvatum]
MAPKPSAQRRARSPQQDRIDNYLFDDVDPFATPEPETQSSKPKDGQGLGIEEEVTVAKRARVPRVKLDETRLLSEAGIPKLRKKARDLKLKGKGHEFSDAARLLSFYQVWLDDLFPKAKFLDALAMVEKAGHKTTMHKERMDWINEGKPKPADDLAYEADEAPADTEPTRIAPVFEKASSGRPKTPAVDDPFDEEDLYAATPGARRLGTAPATNGAGSRGGEPDEDDLDALMAEAEAHQSTSGNGPSTSIFGSGRTDPQTRKAIAEEDDLDALMAEAEAQGEERMRGQPPTEKSKTSLFGPGRPQQPAPATGDDPDDLDALMAEAEAQTGPSERTGSASQNKTAGPSDSFADEEEALAEMDGLW